MLKSDELQETIECLVQGSSDILLYGSKSSGKSTLAKKVLSKVYHDYYIYMSCIILDTRDSFLFLLSFEIMQLLKKLDSDFLDFADKIFPDRFKQPDRIFSLNMWIKDMNKLIRLNKDKFKQIKRIYICVDNIQEIRISQNFLSSFYTACKQQIIGLDLSFFFVGSTLYLRTYSIEKPFNSIMTFFMPKPNIRPIIKAQIQQAYKHKNPSKAIIKLKNHLETKIYNAFETIQNQIQKTKQIVQAIINYSNEYIKNDDSKIALWINSPEETALFDKIKKYGPVQLSNLGVQQFNKQHGREQIPREEVLLDYQTYPSLILMSIFLANGHSEAEDWKRFKDYKRTLSKRGKKVYHGRPTFKKNHKNIRHNFQRIISISETLQDISKPVEDHKTIPYLMEKDLQHHSLDYYGCFEYLREEGLISHYGNTNRAFGGKVMGMFKQGQAKDFFKKMADEDVLLNQFIELD